MTLCAYFYVSVYIIHIYIHIFLLVVFNCAAAKQSCAKFMLARRDRCKNETTLRDALVSGLSRARSAKAHASQAEPFLLSGCCSRTRARGQPADPQLACCSQSCVLAGFPHASAQGCGHTLAFVRQQPVRPTVFHIYIYIYICIYTCLYACLCAGNRRCSRTFALVRGAQHMAMHFWGWIA